LRISQCRRPFMLRPWRCSPSSRMLCRRSSPGCIDSFFFVVVLLMFLKLLLEMNLRARLHVHLCELLLLGTIVYAITCRFIAIHVFLKADLDDTQSFVSLSALSDAARLERNAYSFACLLLPFKIIFGLNLICLKATEHMRSLVKVFFRMLPGVLLFFLLLMCMLIPWAFAINALYGSRVEEFRGLGVSILAMLKLSISIFPTGPLLNENLFGGFVLFLLISLGALLVGAFMIAMTTYLFSRGVSLESNVKSPFEIQLWGLVFSLHNKIDGLVKSFEVSIDKAPEEAAHTKRMLVVLPQQALRRHT